MAIGEKELFKSINKLYEIYIYQLSLLIEIVDYAQKRLEENKQKFFPTEEDLNPSTRFTDNRLIKQLADNKDFRKHFNAYKINWVDEEEMIRKLWIEIRESNDYKDYMSVPDSSYNDDREILIRIVKKQITNSEILQYYYEEKSIHWSDDFYTANMLVIKTLKAFKPNWGESHPLPSLFKVNADNEPDEDREFVKHLFRKTVVHSEEYEKLIEDKVKNWEMDRIAVMDILLIKMALAELIEFPSIPVKVTLNEYIELAKMYSTPKSKVFVNGILDKLIVDLKELKKIKKAGRGLLEN
ncbi:MAG: transcription antitermination factor NusB [Bacteroidetes bacterium]|nr:transcription antitermination factor NusB [Bacteroidota bacterium]